MNNLKNVGKSVEMLSTSVPQQWEYNEKGAIKIRRIGKVYDEDEKVTSSCTTGKAPALLMKHEIKNNALKKSNRKKRKRALANLQSELNEATFDKKVQVSSILSAITALSDYIFVHDSAVYRYDDKYGAYYKLSKHDACVFITSMIKQHLKQKCSVGDVKDAYQKILWERDLQMSEIEIFNTPYVNCKNGVLNLESMKLSPHSPKYGFTSCCNASYDEKCSGETFKAYIKTLTRNDKSLKRLIQEVMGYCLSGYVNAKKAFLFYGVSNSGKSVLLNLLTHLVGSEHICNVDLQHMSNPTYVARLADKKLNIAPDLPSEPIKDIGTFKSLVSNLDTIESRRLYHDPKRQSCNCKLIFASNQPIKLVDADYSNVEAFFNRLIILPCLHAVPEDEQDFFLIDKLKEECDYIFTWAMQGLKRLIENNFQFSKCNISEKTKKKHMQSYCVEKVFCDEYLDFSNKNAVLLTTEIHKLFDTFCDETCEKGNKNALKQVLMNNYRVSCKRQRINKGENPRYAYVGVSVKKF